MALAKDIVAGGISGMSADAINGSINPAVSAAGTVITDATDLSASINVVTTVASGAGVQLYSMQSGDSMTVYNAGANALKVYPPSSTCAINNIAVGVAQSLATNTRCDYTCISSTLIIGNLSA